jgi:DNA polymerase III alpha subunit (gram-positive type)
MKRSLKGNNMNMCLISVDIEATGPTPGHYSMYELGACVVGAEGKFERKLTLLPNAKFSNDALRAVGTTKRKLLERSDTVSPQIAMREFAQWAQEMAQGNSLIFVANNAPFDWMFVAWYFEEFRIKNPFGHSALDMKAFFMGRCGASWEQANFKNMAARTHMPAEKLPHRALLDAVIQGEIFSRLVILE